MRIYAISGSLRAASVHMALLHAFLENMPDGMEMEICDLIGDLPIFNPDLEGDLTPEPVSKFAKKVDAADGLIVAAPEYAHGIPGGLKNAFDWLVSGPELVDKPVMLVDGYTNGRGSYVQAALLEVLRTASLKVMPEQGAIAGLIGKTPAEVRYFMTMPENRKQIQDRLSAFSDWIAQLW